MGRESERGKTEVIWTCAEVGYKENVGPKLPRMGLPGRWKRGRPKMRFLTVLIKWKQMCSAVVGPNGSS